MEQRSFWDGFIIQGGVLNLQIPLSPDPWLGATMQSSVLKALAMQFNKTGWVECALHPYIHSLPARQFNRVAMAKFYSQILAHELWWTMLIILNNAGALGRIWSSVFHWQWTGFFVGIHLACLTLWNKDSSTVSFPFSLCFQLPCQALWREGLPAIRFTHNTQLWFHLPPVAGAARGCFYPSSWTPEGELSNSTLDSRRSQWSSVSGQSLLSKGV